MTATEEQQRVYQTDAYGRIQHNKPSYSVGKDGRIVEVDGYGNKRHDKPQYVIRKDRVYETSYGRIEYHKPSWILEKDGRVVQVDPCGNKRSVCTLRWFSVCRRICSYVESKILRVLSGLGDHVLTHELEAALASLIAALEAAGRAHTANALRVARVKLACSIGMLEKPHGTRRITLIEWESRSWGDKLLDALAGLIEFAVVTPRQVAGRDGSYASTRSPLTAQSLRLP